MSTEREPAPREQREMEKPSQELGGEQLRFTPEQEEMMNRWAEYLEQSLRGFEASLKLLAERIRSRQEAGVAAEDEERVSE